MKKMIVVLMAILTIPSISAAKTFYLDNHAGVTNGCNSYDASARTCGSGSSLAYTDPFDASQALSNGDILYVREGEYYSNVTGKPGYHWSWGSMSIGAGNVLIKNYNNEVAWIKGGPSRTDVSSHPNNAIGFGGSNNVIDGLYIFGSVILGGTNNTLKNCDLSGGWDHQGCFNCTDAGWPNVIRFEASSGAKVQNCVIHNNQRQTGNDMNMSSIMHENDNDTIVENCTFHSLVGGAAYIKYQGTAQVQTTYRYNYFGPNSGKLYAPATANNGPKDIYIYQNIWNNPNTGSTEAGFGNLNTTNHGRFYVYNNTLRNAYKPISEWVGFGPDTQYFNNIFYVSVSGTNYLFIEGAFSPPSYLDHNQYFASGVTGRWTYNSSQVATSLSGWRSYNDSIGWNKDNYSVDSNPNFINSSGNWNTPTDFKRSSYQANGRGGAWPAVMGAYITGNEIIGAVSGGTLPPPPPPPPPPTKVPNPPSGLTVN